MLLNHHVRQPAFSSSTPPSTLTHAHSFLYDSSARTPAFEDSMTVPSGLWSQANDTVLAVRLTEQVCPCATGAARSRHAFFFSLLQSGWDARLSRRLSTERDSQFRWNALLNGRRRIIRYPTADQRRSRLASLHSATCMQFWMFRSLQSGDLDDTWTLTRLSHSDSKCMPSPRPVIWPLPPIIYSSSECSPHAVLWAYKHAESNRSFLSLGLGCGIHPFPLPAGPRDRRIPFMSACWFA
ncbi:hypothetical protein C8Q74DRAFT_95100 [Fomes fomentarius]|nr:hypothetical protein C8Q74DRAFT_95100 [Fomes fomentarius]